MRWTVLFVLAAAMTISAMGQAKPAAADLKGENERLKAEVESLRVETEKLRAEVAAMKAMLTPEQRARLEKSAIPAGRMAKGATRKEVEAYLHSKGYTVLGSTKGSDGVTRYRAQKDEGQFRYLIVAGFDSADKMVESTTNKEKLKD